jgi:PucR C-terminal helix-turn-helix domain
VSAEGALPADVSRLAHVCATAGADAVRAAHRCLLAQQQLWQRLHEQGALGVDANEAGYDVGRRHVALVSNAGAADLSGMLASGGPWQVLQTPGPEEVTWAWIGFDDALSEEDVDSLGRWHRERGASVAIGESGEGLDGFQASHDQAVEAWSVATVTGRHLVLYRDVVLMIALLRDRDLARMFLDRELGELAAAGQREAELRHVARTYLESGQSTVATASKLGCNRRTVERKLKQAERLMGHLLWQRSAEVLLALMLANLA